MFKSNVSKILTGWAITSVIGFTCFAYSKKSVDDKRYQEMLKRREEIKQRRNNSFKENKSL